MTSHGGAPRLPAPGPLHPAVTCPGCGKAGFASRRAALRSAATIAGRPGRRRMRAYRCLLSPGLWHLTSQPKNGQRD
jgi:hypothetical protein